MAEIDSNGNIIDGGSHSNVADSGACVVRTANNNWAAGSGTENMKQVLRKGDAKVLNLFFVRFSNGILGYSTFPWDAANSPQVDGVVIHADSLPGGALADYYHEGDTTVHEVGHWMGLLHTFQGGCGSSEGIIDTPKEAKPNYVCPSDPSTIDTCSGGGSDPVFNFMDYSHDKCLFEFTNGQSQVMQACYNIYRLGNKPASTTITLQRNVLSAPLNLAPGQSQVYQLDITGISSAIKCTTSGDNEGNAALYLKIDSPPTFTKSDCCVSNTSGTSNESCKRPAVAGGRRRQLWRFRRFRGRKPNCGNASATTLYAGVMASKLKPVQGLIIVCG